MHANLDQGAYNWHKSTRSGTQNECVEVGTLPSTDIAVRDTKAAKQGPVLAFPIASWTAFLGALKSSQHPQV